MRSISHSNVTRPGRAAVLVDDERLAHAALPQRRQQIVGRHRFRHRQRLARDRAGVDVVPAGGHRLDRRRSREECRRRCPYRLGRPEGRA